MRKDRDREIEDLQRIERELSQTEYFKRVAGITTPGQFQGFWVSRDGPEVSEEEAVEALEKAIAEPAFVNWLPMVVVTLTDAQLNYTAAKATAEKLQQKISASLGTDSALTDTEPAY